MVKCEICKKKFKVITVKHLKKHNINSMKEYRKMFPNARLVYDDRDCNVNTINFWVRKYGKVEGEKKYEEYKKKMAYSNTFEYKQEKHGWTLEEFNEYNRSRSITLKNMVKKYGKEEGEKKFNEYREKQKEAGCSLKYFISKHGEKKGKLIYEELNKKKALTLKNFIKKYGKKLGRKKYFDYINNSDHNLFTSKNERVFCKTIINKLNEENINYGKVYEYSTKQFGQWCTENDNFCFYDLVFTDLKICIEYNGDYWHCNPKKYNESFKHPHVGKTAKEIWEYDDNKKNTLKNMGFKYIIIWDEEFIENKEKIIYEIVECIKEKSMN